jgi:chromosome segregation ATPase
MRTLKRVLAIMVIVISVVVLVLSLAGIAGTWIVRGQLATGLEGIVTAAETRAEAVQQGLDRLGGTLTQAAGELAAVEQEVQGLGADLEQNQPLLTAISDRLGLQLSPLVDKAREIVMTIRETVAAVNGIVEGINALPFVTRPVPEPEALNKLSQDVDTLVLEIQDLRAAIDQRQSEIVRGAVSLITTPASQIGNTLKGTQTAVSGYSQEISRVQEGLSSLKSALGGWLVWGAVGLTLILLWLALSQGAMLVLGWRAFLGEDLLPRATRRQRPQGADLAAES